VNWRRAIISLCVVIAILPRVARADIANDDLVQMWHQFLIPKTLHATMKCILDGRLDPFWNKKNIETYEFWMDGQKYRCLEKSDTGNGLSNDIRWNGELFQWFTIDTAALGYSKYPVQISAYYSNVPLLRPFQFLFPLGGSHRAEKLNWSDACSDETLKRLSQAHVVADLPGRVEAVFPGGLDQNGVAYTYHIEFAGVPEFLPTKITAITSAGVAIANTEITYKAIQCNTRFAYLPTWVQITARRPDNKLIFIQTCQLLSIEADKPIPPETFTIDFQKARTMRNMDPDRVESTVLDNANGAPPSKLANTSISKPEVVNAISWPVNWLVFAFCIIIIIVAVTVRTTAQKLKKQ
jgi:hypothetical protein